VKHHSAFTPMSRNEGKPSLHLITIRFWDREVQTSCVTIIYKREQQIINLMLCFSCLNINTLPPKDMQSPS
jgi:hypothetical protein